MITLEQDDDRYDADEHEHIRDSLSCLTNLVGSSIMIGQAIMLTVLELAIAWLVREIRRS